MEREMADKIATLVFNIEKLSNAIMTQKDSHMEFETGTKDPLICPPKSTIHEATLCAMESEKEKLERKLEAIR